MNNDSKKSFSFMVIVILCVIMLGIFVVPKLSFNMRKQSILKGNVFHSSIVTYNSGTWDISQVIKDTDNVTLDGLANGTITSTSSDLSENEVILINSISLQKGSNTGDIFYGDCLYSLDLSDLILDGFTYETNFDDNSLDIYNESGKLVAKLYMGDIVSDDYMMQNGYLDPGEAAFAWYYDNGFFIYNYENILVNDEYNRTFELRLDLDYATYKKKTINITGSLSFNNDSVESGEDVTVTLQFTQTETNPLTITNVAKNDGDINKKWNSEWGTEPDAGDSYYIVYDASFDLAADDTYEMLITPNVNSGTLVAYGDGDNFFIDTLDSYINSDYANAVVGNNRRIFIVAYPKPDENATLQNTFAMTVSVPGVYSEDLTWNTTYQYKAVAAYPKQNANDINLDVMDDSVGIGAINKLNNYNISELAYTVESASNEINESETGTLLKGFNNWYASNYGANEYTSVLQFTTPYLSDTYGPLGNEVMLSYEDYAITSIEFKDDIEYDYILDEDNDFYYLEEADINTYTEKKVYYQTMNSGEWILAGTYVKSADGTINYTAIDTNASYAYGMLNFPENTTQVKVEYVGKRAMVYIGYDVYVDLYPTNDVLDYIENNNNVYFKAGASSNSVTDNDYHKLTELEIDTSIDMTSDYQGVINSNNVVEYNVSVNESIPFPNGDVNTAYNVLEDMEYGVFYFLLPRGATLASDVTVGGVANVDFGNTVSQEENYNGSDRTLVKVVLYNNYGNYYEDATTLRTGHTAKFKINYSQVANRDYGNILKLDVMYSAGSSLPDAYKSASDLGSGIITDAAVSAFSVADPTTEYNKLFVGNTTEVDPVTVSSGQAETYVKSSIGREYVTADTIKEGYKYTYKLEYTYSDPLTKFDHLVFYDVLENAYGSNEHVNGTLDSIDVSYLEDSLNINATIYYSYKNDIDLTTDYNLNDETVWTVDEPTNKANVKAIAVDLGAHEFNGINKQIPIVYVNMIGSTNYTKAGLYAYNNSTVRYNDLNENETMTSTSNTTQVLLQQGTFELKAVSKQNIAGSTLSSGSLDFPTRVETNYGYLYTLKNSDVDYKYNNFNINIAVGNIIVDEENISYYYSDYNDAVLISEDEMVTYAYDSTNGTINLTVKEVAKNSSINIWLPVGIDMNTVTSEDAVIVNNSKIDRVEGKAYKGSTVTLYNGVSVPQIDAYKFIENGGVYVSTDQEALKVGKGSTYKFMVKVQNTSDVVANSVNVVDNVPAGLIVDTDSITNDGIYNENNNTITWTLDTLSGNSSYELTYDAIVPSNIPNNTRYSSNAHVTVANPYNPNNLIFDRDTNTITIIYKTSADIVINNQVLGTLINEDKVFNYTVTINGHSYDAGEYQVTDNENNELGRLVVNGEGVGSYEFTLTSGKKVTVRDLPAGVDFTVSQNNESGYTTLEPNNVLIENNGVSSLSSTTTDGMTANYIFNNTYRATGRANVVGKVTYERDFATGDFNLKLTDSNNTYSDTKSNDENGLIHFAQLNYEDEVGSYEYTISQVIGDNERVEYDDNYYKVYVKVTDEGNGTLKTTQTYYDKYDNEVDEILFNNKFIEVGLLIKNTYSGDYIIEDKTFDYTIEVSSDEDGTFEIMDKDGNKIDDFVINDGTGSYETTLGASEYILIKELPVGSQYTIKLNKQQYFRSSVDDGVNEGNYLVANGTIDVSTKKVIFDTVYNTTANYQPSVNVILNEKDLTDGEFEFKIEDISEQSSGYVETVRNDVDGLIDFSNITFNKPGTYVYQITQVKGTSNHIYYDESPIILTLVLADNMDGTMSVESNYTFVDNKTGFVNTYSEEPIVVVNPETNTNPANSGSGYHGMGNPNTIDYIVAFVATLLGALLLTFIIRFVRVKKFNN